jgi:DNA repair exonuclease SbcCD ATPase subunit
MSPFDILNYQMPEPFWHMSLFHNSLQPAGMFIITFFCSILSMTVLAVLVRIPAIILATTSETQDLVGTTQYEELLERLATLEEELKAKDTQLGCELIEVQLNEHDNYKETERLEAAVDAEFDSHRKDMVEMVDDKIHELREGVSMILSEKLDDLSIPDMTGELAFLRESVISQKTVLDEQTKRLNGFSAALPTLLGLDPQIKTLEAQIKALPMESLEWRLASVSKLQGLGDAYLKALETQVKSLPIEAHATRLASLANVQAMSDQNMKALIKAVETRQTLDHEMLQTTASQIKDDLKALVQFLTAGPYPKATALLQILEKNGWPVLQIGTLPPPPPPAVVPVNT